MFGGYASDAPDLGDINIAVALTPRQNLTGKEVTELSLQRAQQSGQRLNFFSRIAYGEKELLKELRAVSRYISLHPINEPQRLGVESMPLFQPNKATGSTTLAHHTKGYLGR